MTYEAHIIIIPILQLSPFFIPALEMKFGGETLGVSQELFVLEPVCVSPQLALPTDDLVVGMNPFLPCPWFYSPPLILSSLQNDT